jgi:hypothetical protein
MIEENSRTAVQRAFAQAYACQDMLARAPAAPSLLTRLRARLGTAVRAVTRRPARPEPDMPRSVSLFPTRSWPTGP